MITDGRNDTAAAERSVIALRPTFMTCGPRTAISPSPPSPSVERSSSSETIFISVLGMRTPHEPGITSVDGTTVAPEVWNSVWNSEMTEF